MKIQLDIFKYFAQKIKLCYNYKKRQFYFRTPSPKAKKKSGNQSKASLKRAPALPLIRKPQLIVNYSSLD